MTSGSAPHNSTAINFLRDMSTALDESLCATREERDRLEAAIGEQRVEELREYWQSQPDSEATAIFLQTAAYRERLLIAVWAKLRKLENLRVAAGRTAMKTSVCKE